MMKIGITGSIAMGKSEALKMFAAAGIPVFDSDSEVHKMYAEKPTIELMGRSFPDAIVDGRIDRKLLGEIVFRSADDLRKLESLVHPLVKLRREKFIRNAQHQGAEFAILDIPLLYEKGKDASLDYVIVISSPESLQRQRALARPGMTAERLDSILGKQMPDIEKRARANFVLDNAGDLNHLEKQVKQLITKFQTLSKAHQK